jgi:hypothetical protein
MYVSMDSTKDMTVHTETMAKTIEHLNNALHIYPSTFVDVCDKIWREGDGRRVQGCVYGRAEGDGETHGRIRFKRGRKGS